MHCQLGCNGNQSQLSRRRLSASSVGRDPADGGFEGNWFVGSDGMRAVGEAFEVGSRDASVEFFGVVGRAEQCEANSRDRLQYATNGFVQVGIEASRAGAHSDDDEFAGRDDHGDLAHEAGGPVGVRGDLVHFQ